MTYLKPTCTPAIETPRTKRYVQHADQKEQLKKKKYSKVSESETKILVETSRKCSKAARQCNQ